MRKIIILIYMILYSIISNYAQSDWKVYENTYIKGNITGKISYGYIFETTSGNIYKLMDYIYLYEYVYNPKVLVLYNDNSYILIIDGIKEKLNCIKINNGIITETANNITAYIINEFNGYEYGNYYELSNGQIWKQIDSYIWVYVYSMPKIIIYNKNNIYYMKFDKINKEIMVERIR